MKRITLYSAILFGALIFIMMFKPASAAIDAKEELLPNKSFIGYYEYLNTTDASNANYASTRLLVFGNSQKISFSSEKQSSLFILNGTEMAKFATGQLFITKKTWANTTSVQEDLTYHKLTVDYGVESYLKNKTGEPAAMIAIIYFAVLNEVNDTNYFSLRIGSANVLIDFIDELFGIIISFVFVYFGVKFLLDARQAQKENQPSKKHNYTNYGIAYFFGGLATVTWELFRWYTIITPSASWQRPFIFADMPTFPLFTSNILSFITFVALGFSIMFMSNTIEKIIQKRKIPIFTYFLLATELLMVAGIFVPVMLFIVPFPWIAALVLAAVNILVTYIKVARITTGELQRQAISILLFLTALYLSISLVRLIVTPEIFGNALSALFAIGLYMSLKNVRVIQSREEKKIAA